MTKGFLCSCCGEYHTEVPLAFGPDAPLSWHEASPSTETGDSFLSSDQCILHGEWFFVRGGLDIPILGSDQVFRWLVWVSVAESSYNRMTTLWNTSGRENEPPYFGWLNTELPGYPSTFNLKVHVHTKPVGTRPFVEVEPTDHPLAMEQRNGLTWEQLIPRIERLLHPGGGDA